MKVIPETHHTH